MGKMGRMGMYFCLATALGLMGASTLYAEDKPQNQSESGSLFSLNPFVFFGNLMGRTAQNAVDTSVPAGGFSPAPSEGNMPRVPGDYHNFLPDFVPGESVYENVPDDEEGDDFEWENTGPVPPEPPEDSNVMPVDEADDFQIDPDQLKDYNRQPESNPWTDGFITAGPTDRREPLDYESHLPYEEMIFDPQTGKVSYRVNGQYMSSEEYELEALEIGKMKLNKRLVNEGYKIMAVGNRLDREQKELDRQISNSRSAGLGHPKDQQERVDQVQKESDALAQDYQKMTDMYDRYENRIEELRSLLGKDRAGSKAAPVDRSQSMDPGYDPFAEADAINAGIPAFGPADFVGRNIQTAAIESPSLMSRESSESETS